MTQSFAKMNKGRVEYMINEHLHEEGASKKDKSAAAEYMVGESAENGGQGVWYDPAGVLGKHEQTVTAKDFRQACDGFHPTTEENLAQNSGDPKRVPGYDFTFSVPKIVTVLHQFGDEKTREQVQKFVSQAVDEALNYMSQEVWLTRRGAGSTIKENAPLVAAKFDHLTNRNGQPNTHIHACALNATLRKDGSYGTIDTAKALAFQRVSANVFHASLAQKLKEGLGLDTFGESGKEAFSARNIPEKIEQYMDFASSRRKEVLEAAGGKEALEAGGIAVNQAAVLKDRKSKQALPADEYENKKDAEAAEQGLTHEFVTDWVQSLSVNRTELKTLTHDRIQEIGRECVAEILDKDSFFPEQKLTALMLLKLQGEASPAEALRATNEVIQTQLVPLAEDEKYQMQYSTQERIDLEAKLAEDCSHINRAHVFSADYVKQKLHAAQQNPDRPMSNEQRAAAEHVLLSPHTVTVYAGAAGAGKTVTALSLRDAFDEMGYKTYGLALAWSAAKNLQKEAGFDSKAIEGFVRKLDKGARGEKGGIVLEKNSVFLVDEAGMVGSVHGAKIVSYAREAGAKIVLTGDLNQHQPVNAGSFMRTAVDTVGEVRIDQVRRQSLILTQTQQSDKPANLDIFDQRDKRGRFIEQRIEVPTDIRNSKNPVFGNVKAVDREAGTITVRSDFGKEFTFQPKGDWREDDWMREAGTNIAKGLARDALMRYHEAGLISITKDRGRAIDALVKDYKNYREANPANSVIVIGGPRRDVRELAARVEQVERKLGHVTGPVHTMKVSDGGKPYEIEIGIGSKLVVRKNLKDEEIFNRDIGTVRRIDVLEDGALRVRLQMGDGKETTFTTREGDPLWNKEGKAISIESANAMTSHGSQGQTKHAAFNMSSSMDDKALQYVNCTRHRAFVKTYLTKEQAHGEIMRRSEEYRSMGSITTQEVLDQASTKWSKIRVKETTYSFLKKHKPLAEEIAQDEAIVHRRERAQELAQDQHKANAALYVARNESKAVKESIVAAKKPDTRQRQQEAARRSEIESARLRQERDKAKELSI